MFKLLQFLFFPFFPIIYFIIWIRHFLYNKKILKSYAFNLPIISVGNLSFGGTGKTVLVESLIRKYSETYDIVVISRGYGRRSKGLIIADKNSSVDILGDEPYQIYKKFYTIKLMVCEKRLDGIREVIKMCLKNPLILLDDAFQHRTIIPSVSILLTYSKKPFYKDNLFPLGFLRDIKSAFKRADILIYTKNDTKFPNQNFINYPILQLNSYLEYSSPIHFNGDKINLSKDTNVVTLCGIGNPEPFENHIKNNYNIRKSIIFSDHYNYTDKDWEKIEKELLMTKIAIFTTEKDFVKLSKLKSVKMSKIPIYYLEIQMKFLNKDESIFYNFLETKLWKH